MSHKLQGLESVVRMPDWRLTTAELFYHLPDHPHVLQSFIWQKLGPVEIHLECMTAAAR
jgi:uncharacterized protein Usg